MSTFLSTTGHVQSCGNLGGPSSKTKHYLLTDSELVPRGKGEKISDEESEKNLKPYIYKQFERYAPQGECARAYLLHHESASYVYAALG